VTGKFLAENIGEMAMNTKRISAILLTVLLISALSVSVVFASSVHLKGGKNARPSFTDGGLYLNATGALSGLGEGDIVVSIVASADVTSSCINPGNGDHRPPGQNPAPLTVTGSQAIPEGEFKNGNVPFNVSTAAPSPTIAGAPDCPNGGWTETIDDLAFTSATITVEQPAGTIVLMVTCTFNPSTSDGAVPNNQVSCTSS
jgi:hypothetical protein